jgi:hypothetical protein
LAELKKIVSGFSQNTIVDLVFRYLGVGIDLFLMEEFVSCSEKISLTLVE